jgi:hypothetical protein
MLQGFKTRPSTKKSAMDIQCGSKRFVITLAIALLALCYGAGSTHAATEFVCTIKNSGGDYSTLGGWQSSNQCDLTASGTKVFSHQGIIGTINDGDSVTGQSSGATGTATHVTSTQILIKGISGTFQAGERVYKTDNQDYVVISNAGDSAIAVAQCYNDLTENATITGWTTNSANYIKIITADGGTLSIGNLEVTGSGVYVVLGCHTAVDNNVIVNSDATLKVLGDKTLSTTHNINVGTPSNNTDTARIICGGLTGEIIEEHSPPPAWYDEPWNYIQKFAIDHTKIDAELTDFRLLVKLDPSNSDIFGKAQSDGDDILFTASDGTTKLDHEIEKYVDTAGSEELVAHVKIPTVSATEDTVFYVYYGNSGASNQQNAEGVWGADYVGVWHLSEDPSGTAPQMKDSTDPANGNHGTTSGSMTSDDQVAGKMGGGLDLDGTDDYVDVTDSASLRVQQLTFAAWLKPATTLQGMASDYPMIFSKQDWSNNAGYLLGTYSRNGNYMGIRLMRGGHTNHRKEIQYSETSSGQWIYVVATYDGTYLRIYRNGVEKSSSNIGSITINHNSRSLRIGGGMKGRLDEVRISDTPRSPAWIKASYYSQSNTLLTSNTNKGVTLSAGQNVNIYGANGEGGGITATGQGFLHNQGPGAGSTGPSGYGAGAGYGGAGGDSDDGGAGGSTYGSPGNPVDLGSGGGTSGGGAGGGAIALDVSHILTINGSLVSDGNPAENAGNGGGGSGGSIKVACSTLAGGGKIQANGGTGAGHGGGGGAGRIYLGYASKSFTGTASPDGGTKGDDNTLPSQDGNGADSGVYEIDAVADTAYWNNETGNGLWSDPGNWSTGKIPGPGDTAIFDGDYSTANCTLDVVEDNLDSIILEDDYNGQVTFNADFVNGGGELTLTSNLTVNSGTILCKGDTSTTNGTGIMINAVNLTVASGAKITANGPPTKAREQDLSPTIKEPAAAMVE